MATPPSCPTFVFTEYLAEEWRPTLGCTEPASIAWAASIAAAQAGGSVTQVTLQCDPRYASLCHNKA